MLTRRKLMTMGAASLALRAGEIRAAVPAEKNATPSGSPCVSHHGHAMATPDPNMTYDQAYIDMMIPHHLSVIALATHAEPLLKDDRLLSIAQAIITTQPKEIDTLKGYRKAWFGSDAPGPMTEQVMTLSMGIASGCVPTDMMNAMDTDWQISTFDSAEKKDLSFVDQVIAHHKMAVDASKVAEKSAEHPELITLAKKVVGAQQAEIEDLQKIRQDLPSN